MDNTLSTSPATDTITGPLMMTDENGAIAIDKSYMEYLDQQITHLDANTSRLRDLLQRHAGTLEYEGLRRDTDLLLNWMTQSANGMRTVRHLFENGPVWLNDLKDRMRLAQAELERLEGEGGAAGPKGAASPRRDLSEVWQGVENVMAGLEQFFVTPLAPVEGQQIPSAMKASEEPVQLLC